MENDVVAQIGTATHSESQPTSLAELLRSPNRWPDTSALLDEALDLEGDARDAWLQALRATQPQQAALIERILSQESDIQREGFLKRPSSFHRLLVASGAETKLTEPPHTSDQPDQFGAYRLIRELGRGGMGVVWLASRTDGQLDRLVALKTLANIGNRIDLRQRFLRERDILSRLAHPNIARLYDAGTSEQGQPFLVLEYVEGLPINEYCETHALSIRERVALFRQVVEAVEYAHQKFIIHRDLKPTNILVTAEGDVRLLDFGIAKLIERESHTAPETALTVFGGKSLTLEYASPEQIRGEPLTAATDVYSLGVILYELLTGSRPHRPARPSPAALEEEILHTEIAWPSEWLRSRPTTGIASTNSTATRTTLRELRGDLDAIVMMSLARKVRDRYNSAASLAEDLAAWDKGLPVLAKPESRLARATRFVERYRLFVAASAAVLVALSSGLAIAWWQAGLAKISQNLAQQASQKAQQQATRADSEALRAREEAVRSNAEKLRADAEALRAQVSARAATESAALAVRNEQLARSAQSVATQQATLARDQQRLAEQEAEKSTATKVFLQNLLNRNSTEQADPRKAQQVTVRELLDQGTAQVLNNNILKPETRIELLGTLRALHSQLGLDARAEELANKAIEIARGIDDGKNHALLRAMVTSLTGLRHSGNPKERERLLAEVGKVIETSSGVPPTMRAEYLLQYSIYLRERDAKKAELTGRESLDLFGQQEPQTIDHARALDNIGVLLQRRSANEEALPFLNESIAIRRKNADASTLLIQPLAHRSTTLFEMSRIEESERDLREALSIARTKLGENHIDTFHVQARLGNFFGYIGRYRDAAETMDGLVDRMIRVLGREERFHLPIIANNVAVVSRAVGNLDRAKIENDLALELWGKYDPNTRNHSIALREKANQKAITGPVDEALALFDESMAMDVVSRGRPFINTILEKTTLLLRLNRLDEATVSLSDADKQSRLIAPFALITKSFIDAQLLHARGKPREAVERFESILREADQGRAPALTLRSRAPLQVELGAALCDVPGRWAEGAVVLERALGSYAAMGVGGNPQLIRVHALLASCYTCMGRNTDADAQMKAGRELASRFKQLSPHLKAGLK